jgi:hypothetical protein
MRGRSKMASISTFSAQLKSDAGVVYDAVRQMSSLFKTVTVIIQHDFDGDIPRGKKAIAAALETYTDLYLCGVLGGSVALTRSKIYAEKNPCKLEGYAEELAAMLEQPVTGRVKEIKEAVEEEEDVDEAADKTEVEEGPSGKELGILVKRFWTAIQRHKMPMWPVGLSGDEIVVWVKKNYPDLYNLPTGKHWKPEGKTKAAAVKKISKKKGAAKRGGAKESLFTEVPSTPSRFPAMFVEVKLSVAEIIVIQAGLEQVGTPAAEKLLSELKPMLEV